MKEIKLNKIKDIISGESAKYSYLFPYRKDMPIITNSVFRQLNKPNTRVDKFIVNTMLDPSYIGWTVKVLLNIDLFPMQIAILQTLFNTTFPLFVGSRGSSKSFLLAVYSILKALFEKNSRIVIVGAGLRQAKIVFNYIQTIWTNAPILRDLAGGNKASPKQAVDQCHFSLGSSSILALPLGDGGKIRGFRASCVVADEIASIPSDIFDIVVRGFASTSRTPIDTAKQLSKIKKLQAFGLSDNAIDELIGNVSYGNQIIYSGTAYYAFNHFAKKYAMWKKIIQSRGDKEKINQIFGSEFAVPDNFDWRDYAIIRLPYTHVQEGLMDQKQLAQAKAVLPRNIFLMEYCAVFVSDSNGVFPRSLIERCTPTPSQPIKTDYGDVIFSPEMHGDKDSQYVMGVDPAAQQDHFAIVILKITPHDTRIVNCWSVNKKEFDKRKQNGLITDHDYYAYCCHKILWFVKRFNIIRIEMDSQGGGYSISEMLRNKKLINKKEHDFPIYEIVDDKNMTDFDGLDDGPHIISLVKPTSDWNAEANRSMHKSFETVRLLFPAFNPIKMQAALIVEKHSNIIVDTYEDCVNEIEELKNEICNIQITQTKSGKERFETIEAKSQAGPNRSILHKDRYSALLLAYAYINSLLSGKTTFIDYNDIAGNMDHLPKDNNDLYFGPGLGRMRNSQFYRNGENPFGSLKNGKIQD